MPNTPIFPENFCWVVDTFKAPLTGCMFYRILEEAWNRRLILMEREVARAVASPHLLVSY